MKKFQFSLNTVLSYKQQRLELLQNEHAAILADVRDAEIALNELKASYRSECDLHSEQCKMGISILEAKLAESRFRAMEMDIQKAAELLENLRSKAESKREEVVEAKKDTTSIEKLKEKKIAAYQKATEKETEHLIDEFVSSVSTVAAKESEM